MPTVASSPSTYTAATPIPVALTFQIPVGVWTSATWFVGGTTTTNGSQDSVYTFPHDEQHLFVAHGTPGVYSESLPATAHELLDINTAAGGTLDVRFSTSDAGNAVGVCQLVLVGTFVQQTTVPLSTAAGNFVTGLVGTITIQIVDALSNATLLAQTTSNIGERISGSGIYYLQNGYTFNSAINIEAIWNDHNGTVANENKTGSSIVGGYVAGTDPGSSILDFIIDGSISFQEGMAIMLATMSGNFSVSYNAGTLTQTTTYYRQDGVTAFAIMVTVYDITTRAHTRTVSTLNWP